MDLISLQARHRMGQSSSWQRAVSVGVHVAVIAAVGLAVHRGSASKLKKKPVLHAAVLVPYAPGHKAMVEPPRPKPKVVPPPKMEPKLAMKQPPPPPPPPGDPTGEADVTVAMADFYPDPKPDLSALPHGTKGDVVVDVVIDETGKVVETDVDQGLGHGVDEAVEAVLQTWTFEPATRAGKPVASKQQLLFHFERA